MGDLNYVYAVARIRVREKSLLSDADILQMTGLKDEAAVISALLDKGWGDQASGRDPDRILTAEETKTRSLVKELGIDDSVFEVLSFPNLYHNLKAGIKEICTNVENEQAFYADDRFGRREMLRILKEKDYGALPEHMQKAAQKAYSLMLETQDGQMCDVVCDRACLEAMEEAGEKSKHAILRDYEESTVAVTDIKIAVRAEKTGKNITFLKEALAPCRSIDVEKLAASATESHEALLDFLSAHGYAEAAEALRTSASAFERWCDNRLIETIRPQKTNPFSIGPVVAYYLAKENEIKTVRIILTGKANGLSEEAIRERVREMYV